MRSSAAVALAQLGTAETAVLLAEHMVCDHDSQKLDIADLKKIGGSSTLNRGARETAHDEPYTLW